LNSAADTIAMAGIHITDIEAAINWWRARHPSPDGVTACPEVLALAEVYALMVYYREHDCDEATMPEKARRKLTARSRLGWSRRSSSLAIESCVASKGS